MNLDAISMDALWRNALGAIPLAIAVIIIVRVFRCRPSTRHALWLMALLSLIAPPITLLGDGAAAIRFFADAGKRFFAALHEEAANSRDAASVALPSAQAQPLAGRPEGSSTSHESWNSWSAILGDHPPNAPDTWTDFDAKASSSVAAMTEAPSRPVHMAPGSERAATVSAPALAVLQADAAPIAAGSSNPSSKSADSSPPSSVSIDWKHWLASVAAVRDAVIQLPPIPTLLWLGGSVAIVVLLALRILRFRHVLRDATPASESIVRSVARAAESIGLRSTPQTLMTSRRVSPMIWCGRRCVLLLPTSLWAELDEVGRRAVLLHELAHLRRRDHWVRWLDLAVGCLYWWHPVAWFIRKRLCDEADFCCDAWVTSLLPGGRTAYARALLATRQYISDSQTPSPAVGLGMTSNRTKRFARRLTMVMTERTTPRLSAVGGGLAMCLAAAAWLATPLWACPPDQVKDGQAKAAMKAPRLAVIAPSAPANDESTFEMYMADRDKLAVEADLAKLKAAKARDEDSDVDDRIDRLEDRLNRLSEQLERLLESPRGQAPAGGVYRTRPHAGSFGAVPAAPAAPAAPSAPTAPASFSTSPALAAPSAPSGVSIYAAPMAPGLRAYTVQGGLGGTAVATGVGSGGVIASFSDDGQVITRIYRLPEGKRQALYELMARSDVPVRVSANDQGISVQASPGQHEIFAAFVELINPQQGSQKAAAIGTAVAPLAREREAAAVARARDAAAKARKHVEKVQAAVLAHQQASEFHRTFTDQRAELERQINELNRRAEELSRKARDLERQSDKLQSQAGSMADGPERDALIAQAEALEAQAEGLDDGAEAAEDQADALTEAIESLIEQLAGADEAAASVGHSNAAVKESAAAESSDAHEAEQAAESGAAKGGN